LHLGIPLTVSEEAKLHLGSSGLRTAVVDAAQVMMHDIHLSPPAFRHTPSGSFTVGTALDDLSDYTAKADADQTVDFNFRPETRKLGIEYNGYEISAACIDPDAIRQEPDIPEDLDLPNHFTVSVEDMKDRLEVCAMVNNNVAISCDPDDGVVQISAQGDTDDVITELTQDDLIRSNLREHTRSLFSTGYLVNASVGSGQTKAKLFDAIPSEEVTITIGQEFPMWLDYEYADGHGEVRSMLAPRLEDS